MSEIRRPAAFLDRDGTINVDCGYAHRVEQLEFVKGAPEAIRALNDAGYLVIVTTNQSGIGRGYYREADMHAFHTEIDRRLAEANAKIDAWYHCSYHEDAVIPAFRYANHPDRKPNPGMLLRAIQERAVDPARSFMIGDMKTDVAAAKAAGIAGYLFSGGSLADFVHAIFSDRIGSG